MLLKIVLEEAGWLQSTIIDKEVRFVVLSELYLD